MIKDGINMNKKQISLKEIQNLYNEIKKRESGETWITKYDGTRLRLDTGYSFEGIEFFINEIEHLIESKNNE